MMKNLVRCSLGLSLVLVGNLGARAGLYYSGEDQAELPSQWRGFLIDQRSLRMAAVKPGAGVGAGPLRLRYEDEVARLEKAGRDRKLTADEKADLGALYVRLGEAAKAVEVLRAAQREHADHFRIAANLGTAWQMQGDLDQAAAALEQAVRLAPEKLKPAEEYHLKLVRLRQKEAAGSQGLDDLFGVRFVGDKGEYEPGKLAKEQREKLPKDAVAVAQQLALWLPADPRLLWLLAELAGAFGDLQTAAAIMDGCVTEFGLNDADMRQRRRLTRSAADEKAKLTGGPSRAEHESHVGGMMARSKRPLVNKIDLAALPPIKSDGINTMPWSVLAETSLDRNYRPTFMKYLQDLDGKQVALTGFMQTFGDELEASSFMLIEYPVGCWYCEVPPIQGIILVELPPDQAASYRRSLVKVTGKLTLNATDPENFLYIISRATVAEAD
jgi:tetratricopeptide (TPR) repeat protein